MSVEDMIFISVDDHVVEPPDMFEGRLPAKYADRAPAGRAHRRRRRRVGVRRHQTIPNIGLNAVAGRPEGGVRRQPDRRSTRCARAATTSHERVKDMSAGGVLACMCFPSFPSFSGRLFARRRRQGPRARGRAGLQRLAHRRVVRRLSRAASSRWRCPCCGIPSCARPRSAASPTKGCHSLTFTENPADARAARASTTRTGTRCGARSSTRARSSTSTSARRASSRSPRPTRRST